MFTEQNHQRFTLNGATMGTRYGVVVDDGGALDRAALARALHDAVCCVDAQMSNWDAASDICRLNRALCHHWVDVPASLIHVLETALEIEALSQGAFDIGVGAQVAAWGFGPDAGRIGHATLGPRPVTRETLEIDAAGGRVRKHAPLSLDLAGIAKGYGVDQLADVLAQAGLTHWLASIDGEVRAGGTKADGTPWALGLEQPTPGTRRLGGVIEITDLAVATSGTYRQTRVVDGRSVSHTINPATGAPIAGGLTSVTVFAPTCMAADAWASAILVEGAWPPKRFSPPPEIDALVFGPQEG